MNIQPLVTQVATPEDRLAPAAAAEPRQAQPAQAKAQPATDEAAAEPTPVQLAEAVQQIKQALPASAQSLEFSIDDDSKQTVVKVVDQNTKEVLRQIPSSEALELAKSLDKAMGRLISQKA